METQTAEAAPIRTRVLDIRVTGLKQLARRPSVRPEPDKVVPVADFQSSI